MKQEQWDELKRLHRAATGGKWEFKDGAANEFVISGNAAICALPGVSSRKKDFKYIAAIHNAFPQILAEREAAIRLRDAVANWITIDCPPQIGEALATFDKESKND